MHILLDARTSTEQQPGIARYTFELAVALGELFAETGDRLTVVCNPEPFVTIQESEAVRVTTCSADPLDPAAQMPMRKLAEQLKPDVYHTPYRLCPTIGYDAAPVVVTIHSFIPMRCQDESTPQQRIVFLKSMHDALKACTCAIAVSENTHKDLRHFFPDVAAKCEVVRNGVTDAFKPLPEEHYNAAAVRYEYERPAILYLGSNVPHKNVSGLLKGYAHAKPLLHGIKLVVAGFHCEPTKAQLHLLDSLGIKDDVTWLRNIQEYDLPAVLGSACAFVFPSLYEGFGLPVLEAMAVGTPVACSHTPALADLGGDAVRSFDPEKPEDIAQALVDTVRNDDARARMRAAGLERAAAYRWRNAALETLDLYKRTVTRHQQNGPQTP